MLEKNKKKRRKELDRVTAEHKVLQDVIRNFIDETDVNQRHDREMAIEASQQWNGTSLERNSMQSSSTTTRVGTVCCVVLLFPEES